MRRPVVALVVSLPLLLGAPTPSQAALPKPVAKPGGIYTGPASLSGVRCSKPCRVRVVLSSDGLEIQPTSSIRVPSRCLEGELAMTRVRSDGTFSTVWTSVSSGTHRLRGRFSRDGRTLRGSGRLPCFDSGRAIAVRFSARRTGRVRPPAATATTECIRLYRAKTVAVSAARGLGCGVTHDAVRAVLGRDDCKPSVLAGGRTCAVSGLTCRFAAARLLPAANVVCAPPGGGTRRAEIVPITECASVADRWVALAGPGVGCTKARAVATSFECEDEKACTDPGFKCTEVPGGVLYYSYRGDPFEEDHDPYYACVDKTNPARVVEVDDQSSDSV